MGCISSNERNLDIEPLPVNCKWNDWLTWKQKLRDTIANRILENEVPCILGRKLKRVIGPYGLEIIKNFTNSGEENFHFLLRKLELFFYLRLFPRDYDRENITEYIQRLSTIASEYFGSRYPDVAVKENITFELKENNFLHQISRLVSIRNIIDLKTLNIKEIIFLVNTFDNRESRSRRENFLQRLKNKGTVLRFNENCCGQLHSRKNGICPARGQNCYKCHGLNHFAVACNKRYITNCENCGINHPEKQCDAFGKECSRCQGFNHFYWKCFLRWVVHCPNCGGSHVDSARRCPGFGRSCLNCNRVGHLTVMCRSRRRR